MNLRENTRPHTAQVRLALMDDCPYVARPLKEHSADQMSGTKRVSMLEIEEVLVELLAKSETVRAQVGETLTCFIL